VKPSGAVHGLTKSDDPRLVAALEEYMALAEAGCAPEREEFLGRYPELAQELAGCLDALEALAGPTTAPGKTLGDFRLLREVGRGGMGVVYEAEQVSLGRRVALKVLPTAATMDARALQRFQNEARAAASLQHEHIVPVYAVGSEGDTHFYAMQFVEGRSLAGLISAQTGEGGGDATTPYKPGSAQSTAETRTAQTRMSFAQVARWGAEAAEALEYAHSMGVVHRDVKPGNLLIDSQERLWVADFGLARVASEVSLTGTGDVLGTLRYMSPEQARAQHGLVDHRSDVYSLGATLYEILAGRPAFAGDNAADLLCRVVSEEPTPLRRLDAAIPTDLETIVMKAMEKAPEERYATAKEMAEDLRRFLADEPIRAKPPGLGQRLGRWARRRWRVVVAAACVLLLLAGLAGANWFWWTQRQAVAEAQARAGLEEAGRFQSQERWEEGLGVVRRSLSALDGTWADAGLRRELEERERDLEMGHRLEEARLRRATQRGGAFDNRATAQAYAEAFEWYGLDVQGLGTEELAERISSRPIRTQLVAALHDWANRASPAQQRRLLVVCRLARPSLRQVWDVAEGKGHLDTKGLAAAITEENADPAAVEALLEVASRSARDRGAIDEEVLVALRRAQQLRADDFWLNESLGLCCVSAGPARLEEAIRYLGIAVGQRPRSSGARLNLAFALHRKGDWDGAAQASRQAIALDTGYAQAHANLGAALFAKGDLDGAIKACLRAISLLPTLGEAHNNLGIALAKKKDLDGAIKALQRAASLERDGGESHANLGFRLREKGDLDGAIRAFRGAIRLNPRYAEAHLALGQLLLAEAKDPDGALVHLREVALNLARRNADAHYYMGAALATKGCADEAIRAYRNAVDIAPEHAEAHCNLGHLLKDKGQLQEALSELRCGHDLGIRRKDWKNDSARWVRVAKVMVSLEAELGDILKGAPLPKEGLRLLQLGQMAQEPYKRLYATSARCYAAAFKANPKLIDIAEQCRYAAACTAAKAACGKGQDSASLNDMERKRLRQQALSWLRAEMLAWKADLARDPSKAGSRVGLLRHCLGDPDFNGVRGEGIDKLPEDEREGWRTLWNEVANTLASATKATRPK
jgi:tetratricopeptide (TPR) repeat protein/tRNA A-37 threonylcarbamoyl transferase component Bud32